MPARALTDVEVRSLKAGAAGRLVVFDEKARGLCLRVSSRSKSWSYVYRAKGSPRQRRVTIGDYPAWSLAAAREKALALRRAVQDGGDPAVEARTRRDALTVAGMVERFIERYAKQRLRSWRAYEAALNLDILPAFGDRKATELTRAEVGDLLDKVAVRAPVSANRLLNMFGSCCSWALSEGLLNDNPCRGLKKRTQEIAKDRFLSDDEIRAFWQATGEIAPGYRDVFRLILLTGQRPGECAGITAEEVDIDKGVWLIPGERAKNRQAHAVPLIGEALEIVKRLRSKTKHGPLIEMPRGGAPSSQDVAQAFKRLRKGLFEDVTPHDLRRTAATLMGRLGLDQMAIGRVLNHSSTTKATITGSVYDRHDYLPQKRRALEALSEEIAAVVAGRERPSNVTSFRSGADAG